VQVLRRILYSFVQVLRRVLYSFVQVLRRLLRSVAFIPTGSARKKHLFCMSLFGMLSNRVRRSVIYVLGVQRGTDIDFFARLFRRTNKFVYQYVRLFCPEVCSELWTRK
jgi:hypothetical protein